MWNFNEGVAAVKKNVYWGFIDTSGKEVIPLVYDNIEWFNKSLHKVSRNGKRGMINRYGIEVIPAIYDTLYVSSNVMASSGQKGALFDINGKELTTKQYDNMLLFSNDRSLVSLNGKVGFIDRLGQEVIPLQYEPGSICQVFMCGIAIY